MPAPRPSTNKYGGNTPCVEMRVEDQVLIFDAGSGIRPLGARIQRDPPKGPINVFFTHYHWDHIHGFPFFTPAYVPGNHLIIRGQPEKKRTIQEILAGQMARPYFPVPIGAMQARFDFADTSPGERLRIGPATVRTGRLNHPGRAQAYRVDYDKRSVVYATDHEHGTEIDEELIQLADGANILIYDACYTTEEYRAGRQGWGHSTWAEAVRIAKAAGVEKLILFHHEPSRNDRALMSIEQAARRAYRGTSAAREGKTYIP